MKIGDYKAPDKAGLRRFGLVTGSIFIGLFGLIGPLLRHRHGLHWPHWPWYPGVFFIAMGVVLPQGLAHVHRGWMLAGGVLGWINTRIILTVVFFAIVTPLAFLKRIVGKDSLGRTLERSKSTYRVESHELARERMKEPF